MAKEEHYYTKFESGRFYHIYNRTVDKKKMFVNDGNYAFFLKKFTVYLNELVDVYAYCLLDNHFHFLVRIKEKETENLHETISKQLRLLFQSYALAFNKQQNRTGTLFQTPFKRALIKEQEHLFYLIYYIHHNPNKHKLTGNFTKWKWSSYRAILSKYETKLKRLEVLEWFGGEDNFVNFHDRELNNFTIDDF